MDKIYFLKVNDMKIEIGIHINAYSMQRIEEIFPFSVSSPLLVDISDVQVFVELVQVDLNKH